MVLLVVAVVAALVHAGDEGGSGAYPSGEPAQLLAAAPGRVAAADTVKVRSELRFHINGKMRVIAQEGAFDQRTQHGHFVVDPESRVFAHPLEIIAVGNRGYIRVPSERRDATSRKPWVGVDLSQFQTQGLGTGREMLANLNLLSAVGTQVEEVGHDVVNGVKTTRYRAQLDLHKVAQQLPPGFAAATAALDQVGDLKLPPLDLDIWLDGAGVPRRMDVGLSFQGQSFEATTEITATDEPLSITAPPDADVLQVHSLQQALALTGATPQS